MAVDHVSPSQQSIPVARGGSRGQSGETLIETLIAIVILALVAMVAYSGLWTTIEVSLRHKESAVAETLLRSAAEQLQDPTSGYLNRAGCDSLATYTNLPSADGWDDEANGITPVVRFWNSPDLSVRTPDSVTFDFAEKESPKDCPGTDPGIQLIELSIVTPSGFTESLDIVKRRG